MARAKSLLRSQTSALLIRSWHFERRQGCQLVCNYIIPPIIFILLAVLRRALVPNPEVVFPFQQQPKGAFVARPFRADSCLRSALFTQQSPEKCVVDPFQPKYSVPVHADASIASAIGSRDAKNTASNSGLLSTLSLEPFVYPGVIPPSEFADQQTQYDGVFQSVYSEFEFNDIREPNPAYQATLNASREGRIDEAYEMRTRAQSSLEALKSTLYDSWFTGRFLTVFSSALSFDAFESTSSSLKASATIFYNESSNTNCTEECSVVSNVVRLYDTFYKQLMPGNSATTFLRRMPRVEIVADLGIVELVITIILGLTTSFLFPTALRFLVMERTSRLRSMMAVMGLRRPQYWFGTYLALLIQFLIATILTIIVGAAAGIPFYRENAPISFILLFFLWGNVLVAMAFLFAPFFQTPETAQIVGWLFIFLVNLIGGPYIGRRLSDGDTSESTWAAIMILPSFAYMRPLYYAGALNSGGKGVTVGSETYAGVELGMCTGDAPFCRSYLFLAVEWIVIMVLAVYFERVLPNEFSSRLHPLFFLGFKRGVKENTDEDTLTANVGQDVLDERQRARHIVENIETEPFDGVVLEGLTKTYPGKVPVKALNNLSLVAHKDEVLCILAHNGAGKTTAFRTLVGELGVTAGTAYICGYSILNDMDKVHQRLGVTQQQDILWRDLTVEQHLFFYGRVKNLSRNELKADVESALDSVQLGFARKRQVKALSGGMKRRLSVSISLIGNPGFLVLDEPSTGLDILAREKLWEAITRVKHNKVVMLTTHSLEEAEALSTRVAIMSRGELKCIGKAEELKMRLGKGHHLSVSLPVSKLGALHDAIQAIAPGSSIETELGGSVEYILPRHFPIPQIFKLMHDKHDELEIRDWSVNESSLEDVFLRVTRGEDEKMPVQDNMAQP